MKRSTSELPDLLKILCAAILVPVAVAVVWVTIPPIVATELRQGRSRFTAEQWAERQRYESHMNADPAALTPPPN